MSLGKICGSEPLVDLGSGRVAAHRIHRQIDSWGSQSPHSAFRARWTAAFFWRDHVDGDRISAEFAGSGAACVPRSKAARVANFCDFFAAFDDGCCTGNDERTLNEIQIKERTMKSPLLVQGLVMSAASSIAAERKPLIGVWKHMWDKATA